MRQAAAYGYCLTVLNQPLIPLGMLRKLLVIMCLCVPLLSFTKKVKKKAAPQQTTADKIDYRQLNAPLPPIRLITPDTQVVTGKMLKNNANLFVMMFNPLCEHCEDMTSNIVKNIDLFKKSKMVLVAASMMTDYMKYYEGLFKLNKYPQIILGRDSSKVFDRLFNYNNLPQINIYDHNHRLIRTINGQETVDSLRKYIE